MKWREVKILCVGLCVCTVIAGADAMRMKKVEAAPKKGTESVARTITDAVEEIVSEHTQAEVEQRMAYEVGSAAPEETCEEEIVGAVENESNLIIADVTNYVNIRSLPSEEGEILGKLYDDSVGRRLGEENGWYEIESGRVKGYVKAEFVLIGEEAERRAKEVGIRLAEVTTTTLKVRQEATTESAVLGLVPIEEILTVLEETEGWVKVDFEDGSGYVSTDYVRVYTKNVEAESKEEEAARLKKEEEERKKAEEAAKAALAAGQEANKKPTDGAGSSSAKPSSGNNSGSQNNSTGTANQGAGSGNSSGNTSAETLGQEIANYALKFVGNPYVYGGTSLPNGADCSCFVQSVYKHFGISLPRTSGEQGKAGRAVDGVANAKPGDLVWYSGHIGIYIGNNQIVHASNPKNGIIISDVNYRTILGIRRIV